MFRTKLVRTALLLVLALVCVSGSALALPPLNQGAQPGERDGTAFTSPLLPPILDPFVSPLFVPSSWVYLPVVMKSPPWIGAGDTYHVPAARSALGLQWWYDWSPTPGGDGVPMIWSGSGVGATLDGDPVWLLGFNEPDRPDQANMSPESGAWAWRNLENAYPGRKLVSPAVLDLTWLDQWWSAYINTYHQPPRVDALGMHCYAFMGDAASAIQHCQTMVQQGITRAQSWGVDEVWLTEWGHVFAEESDQLVFMDTMLAWLKTKPLVTRIAWFQTYYTGNEPWAYGWDTRLWDGVQLTPLGQRYSQH